MCQSSMPVAPNPTTTAAAQTASNVDTAKAQATLNNVNQVTPYGNLTYTSTTGSDGVPHYTATESLSPAEQKLLTTNLGTQQNLANTASTESGKLSSLLDTPLDLSSANLDAYTNTHFLDQFNQQHDQDQAKLQTQLANQGIQVGSTAYTNAMNDFNNQKSNDLNSMLGTEQANAQSAILAQRETPINELIGLAGGTQVTTPNIVSTPQTQVAGTDVAGITNSAYQDELAAAQYQNQQSQSLLGGLFGLGGDAIFKFSDARLKDDVEKVGELPDHTGVFEFSYKPETGLPAHTQTGFIAQDVERHNPAAVRTTPSGYKAVDYGKVIHDAMLKEAMRRAA